VDVYPRRFESRKTGRAGYAPACANEWVRGVCEKPRIKCADCPNRRFPPVTDEVIRWHLSGKDAEGQAFVAGVYPLLLDETCFFLAVDFDKVGWQADALAFMDACMRLQLPAALERSRSGRAARARSASEAFLFRRLETLAERRGGSASTSHSRSRSMAPAASKSICFAEMHDSPWNWTAASTSPTRSSIAVTGRKTSYCRRTDIWFCAFSQKMWVRNSTRCSMRYCER
jgi:hypothetical protein